MKYNENFRKSSLTIVVIRKFSIYVYVYMYSTVVLQNSFSDKLNRISGNLLRILNIVLFFFMLQKYHNQIIYYIRKTVISSSHSSLLDFTFLRAILCRAHSRKKFHIFTKRFRDFHPIFPKP